MKEIHYKYRGVPFTYYLGFYNLDINGDIEFKCLYSMKRYIRRLYLPAMEGIRKASENFWLNLK